MSLDGTYTAVLDRIEGDLAVFEVVDDEEKVELLADLDGIPEAGRHPDAVFEIVVEDGELQDATYDESETEEQKDSAQSRFDRLSSRPPNSDRE
jgi:hypothetical protein